LPDPADNTLADRSRRYNQRRREIRMTRSWKWISWLLFFDFNIHNY
jgi:hypothetical protein